MRIGQQFIRFLDKKHKILLLISLFLIFIGSRAAVINYSGSSTPFWDEWDGEAASLLRPYIQGKLTIGDLLRPFGEHIILFTRLTTLVVFNISGYWDVVLQILVNAIVSAATVVGISFALSRVLRGGWAQAVTVVCTFISAIPISGDSILMGFHTQFYFLLTFSFTSLWFLADTRAWSPRWGAGVLCAVASYLSMASGALTFAAAMGLHLSQMACGRREGLREWLGVSTLAAATGLAVSLVPHVPDFDVYRPHSLSQFLVAFLRLAKLASPHRSGISHGLAVGAILPAHIRGPSGIERRPLVQRRSSRVDLEPTRHPRGRTGGRTDCEPLFRGAADRRSDQPDKRLLAIEVDIAVARNRQAAQSLDLPVPRCLASARRSFVGASGAPPAGLLQLPAPNCRGPDLKFARLSRQREGIVSGGHSRCGNPLPRLEPAT